MVDKIKMERIERRYASQELERMLAEARAGVGEQVKKRSYSARLNRKRTSVSGKGTVTEGMMEVRNKERDLINLRKKHMKTKLKL